MMNIKVNLVSESYVVDINEKTRSVFAGKLLTLDDNVFTYAFVVEGQVMRLTMTALENEIKIKQEYPDSVSEMNFISKKAGKYNLKLNNGYNLQFITETDLLEIDDFRFTIKYYLKDEKGVVISINEIQLIGETEVC